MKFLVLRLQVELLEKTLEQKQVMKSLAELLKIVKTQDILLLLTQVAHKPQIAMPAELLAKQLTDSLMKTEAVEKSILTQTTLLQQKLHKQLWEISKVIQKLQRTTKHQNFHKLLNLE